MKDQSHTLGPEPSVADCPVIHLVEYWVSGKVYKTLEVALEG